MCITLIDRNNGVRNLGQVFFNVGTHLLISTNQSQNVTFSWVSSLGIRSVGLFWRKLLNYDKFCTFSVRLQILCFRFNMFKSVLQLPRIPSNNTVICSSTDINSLWPEQNKISNIFFNENVFWLKFHKRPKSMVDNTSVLVHNEIYCCEVAADLSAQKDSIVEKVWGI